MRIREEVFAVLPRKGGGNGGNKYEGLPDGGCGRRTDDIMCALA